MTGPIHSRQINAEIVRQMAESLMLLNGSTTILDVKMALRQQSYRAVQSEISSFMTYLAEELEWGYQYKGVYRIYFMDAEAKYISPEETLNKVFQHRANAVNLPLNTYLEYRNYFQLQPKSCRLSYYGVIKNERQLAQFYLHDALAKGYFQIEKEAGFEFNLKLNAISTKYLQKILAGAHWDALRGPITKKYLLGERHLTEQAYLPSGEKMATFRVKKRASNPTTTRLFVSNAKLYRVDIRFTNGQQLVLKRSQLDLKRVLLPLVKELLSY